MNSKMLVLFVPEYTYFFFLIKSVLYSAETCLCNNSLAFDITIVIYTIGWTFIVETSGRIKQCHSVFYILKISREKNSATVLSILVRKSWFISRKRSETKSQQTNEAVKHFISNEKLVQ